MASYSSDSISLSTQLRSFPEHASLQAIGGCRVQLGRIAQYYRLQAHEIALGEDLAL